MADNFDSLLKQYPQYGGGGSDAGDNGFDSLLKQYPNYTPPPMPKAPAQPAEVPDTGIIGAYANTLGQAVKQLPSQFAQMYEGPTPYTETDAVDKFIAQQDEQQKQFENRPEAQNQTLWGFGPKVGDIYKQAPSIAGSIATSTPSLAGIAGGFPGIAAGAALGSWGMGRQAEYQQVRQAVEQEDYNRQKQGLPPLNDQEKIAIQNKAIESGDITKTAWANAAPEYAGNVLEAGLLATPLGRGAGLISKIGSPLVRGLVAGGAKALGTAGTEVGEELLTNQLQNPINRRMGLPEQDNLDTAKQTLIATAPFAALGFGTGVVQNLRKVPSPDVQDKVIEQGGVPSTGGGEPPIEYGEIDQSVVPQKSPQPGQNLGKNLPPDFAQNPDEDIRAQPQQESGIEQGYSDTNPFMWDQRGVRTPSGVMPLYDFFEYQKESGMDDAGAYRATLARARIDYPLTPDELNVVKTSEQPQLQAMHQRALQQSIAQATPQPEEINYGEIPTDAVQPWQTQPDATQTGQGTSRQETLLGETYAGQEQIPDEIYGSSSAQQGFRQEGGYRPEYGSGIREQQQGQQGLQQPAREGQGPGQEVRFSRAPEAPVEQEAPRFYSQLRRVVEAAPPTALGTGAQFKQWLNGGTPKQMGVKEDEIHWSGINDYLDSNKKTRLTKDDVLSFLDRPESGAATQDIALSDTVNKKALKAASASRDKAFDTMMSSIKNSPLTDQQKQAIPTLAYQSMQGYAGNYAKNALANMNMPPELARAVEDYKTAEAAFDTENMKGAVKTKYGKSEYKLPGGKNYEELVVTAPNAEQWGAEDDAHYGDVGKGQAVAWARMDTRKDEAGNEGILLHEIQSKRSMEGRAKGFRDTQLTGLSQSEENRFQDLLEYGRRNLAGDDLSEFESLIKRRDAFAENKRKTPASPYVTTAKGKPTDAYVSLLMKKAVSKAVDEDKSFVAWTRGDQQADFYNLSKHVESVKWYIRDGVKSFEFKPIGSYAMLGYLKDDGTIRMPLHEELDGKKLHEVVGENIANKIIEEDNGNLAGLDFNTAPPKWTGQMYGDESGKSPTGELSIITQAASDLAKRYGGQIGMVKTKTGNQPALIITPQMRKRIKGEGMARFSKKKPLAAEQTNSEAFKAWSYDAPLIKSSDAETYDFKSGQKVVVEAFHGTGRPDRVGETFKKKRATSGPMSFFSSNPSVSSGYAQGKADTSLALEDQAYETWFKYKPKGWRGNPVDIVRAWYSLSTEDKAKIAERMPDIRQDDDGNITYEKGQGDPGSYQWELQQTQRGYDKRGNPLKAAVETWLNGGVLFGYEEEFMQVLKLAGFPMKDVTYDSPQDTFPFVYKTYIRMRNPLVTNDMPEEVVDALKIAAKRDRTRAKQYGADIWDKNTRTLKEWVANFLDPNNPTQSYVWTSIPDKVTDVFKSLGYDGIIDYGGKGGGKVAPVYIPFEENQIKSAIGNKGTFNEKSNILRSKGGTPAPYTSLTGFRRAFAQQLDKEMGAGWTESLLKTGLVKFIPKNQVARILNGGEALFHAAWQGSPADFDKHDSAYIGTGEGGGNKSYVGAFGWGHYFADLKEIAEYYKNTLSNYYPNGIPTKRGTIEDEAAAYVADAIERQAAVPYGFARREAHKAHQEEVVKQIEKWWDEGVEFKKSGKLYQVELAPTQDEYLDWDKPLSEQSELVKKAYDKFLATRIAKRANKSLGGDLFNKSAQFGNPTGKDIYGSVVEGTYGTVENDHKAASELLHKLGIRGIRYKAEGGKSAANNYVIFSDEDISIQAKYSQGMYSGVKAFYNPADQQTYFVYDNIGQNEDLYKLSLHELANHALQLNKSDKEFQSILKQFAALRATDKGVQAAYARVPKDTAKNLVDEEGLGYFLETHPNHSLTKRLVAWLRKMIRSLATHWPVLQRAKFAKWANDLTTDDLIGMARDALAMAPAKLGERGGGEVLASKAPAEDLVSLFKALSPRAKPATRQAAEARIDDHPQAEAIRYVERNFYDILSRMEESGAVKIEC